MSDIVNGLLLRERQILLAHRSAERNRYPDTWSFPGGQVEPDETLEEALLRELNEEIGVTATSFELLDSFRDVNGDATFHLFLVNEWQGNPMNLGHEHTEIRWVDLALAHQMPNLTFPVYNDIFWDLAKARSGKRTL